MSLWCAVLTAAIPGLAAAQYQTQSFRVTSEPVRATVGDSVTLRFRVTLDERDLLTDSVPRPVAELPPGVRLLSVERLRRRPYRVFEGKATLAYFRPGRQRVPVFGLPYARYVTGHRGMIRSDSAEVEIVPVLAAANPSLRDIKELEPVPAAPIFWLGLGLAALGLAWYALRRRPPAREAPPPMVMAPAAPPPDAYQIALTRLTKIEQEGWALRGEVDRHYEAVGDVLRDYLEAAEELPARERTSSELLWSLPPRLAESGLRRRFQQVLGEADLVKFARRRPDPEAASVFLSEAGELLAAWRNAARPAEELDAVR
ncbi:MAG: hypothetical protein ACR2HK_13410 [Gemmatimonadales bacterium]